MNYNKLSGVQFAYICNKNGYLYGYPAAKPFFCLQYSCAPAHAPDFCSPNLWHIFVPLFRAKEFFHRFFFLAAVDEAAVFVSAHEKGGGHFPTHRPHIEKNKD